jgi:hypothetical protein
MAIQWKALEERFLLVMLVLLVFDVDNWGKMYIF